MLSGIWLLNEKLESIPSGRLLNFTSNGTEFKGFGGMSGWAGCLCYFTTTDLNNDLQFAYENNAWNNDVYRTINIAEGQEDADLLAWLEVNAVRAVVSNETLFYEKMNALNDTINAKCGSSGKHTIDGMIESVNSMGALADPILDNSISGTLKTNVTTLRNNALNSCTALVSIEAPNLEIINSHSLSGCTALVSIEAPNLETIGTYAFNNCTALENISFPKLTEISNYAFQRCRALKTVDLPLFESSNGYNHFEYCTALETVNLPSATFLSQYMFRYCESLVSIECSNVTSMSTYVFFGCESLTTINLPLVTKIPSYTFQNTNITNLNLPLVTILDNHSIRRMVVLDSAYIPLLTSIGIYSLTDGWSLKALIITQTDSVCTLSNTNAFDGCYHLTGTVNNKYNPNGDKDCYIYVADTMVDSYKSATNWSTYADQIKPLSELPQEYKELYGL